MSEHKDDNAIKPAPFQPPENRSQETTKNLPVWRIATAALLVVLLAGLWFILTAISIKVDVTPMPDSLELSGGLILRLESNYLLRPGNYTVHAQKQGYRVLDESIAVTADSSVFEFALTKLPGLLRVSSEPEGAELVINDKDYGATPVQDIELESGEYSYSLSAPRYQTKEGKVQIEGLGRQQALHESLLPGWADVLVQSEPQGALLQVDGLDIGNTAEDGITAQIMPGKHLLTLSLAGYQDWNYSIVTNANEKQSLPLVKLEPAYGQLQVSTEPSGARVSLNGEYKGLSPINVELRPDTRNEIAVSKAGYRSATKTVNADSDAQRELNFALTPILGKIVVTATPADAVLYVDGVNKGKANQTVALTTAPHILEIRKPGYATYRKTVTPRQAYQQQVSATLLTEHDAFLAQFPGEIKTSTGDVLKLIEPGSFTTGSPRREQGRQSNEVQRDIKLTRMYYLATKEVTNAAFRQFRAQHSSGIVQRTTLDNDNYPVARVSWKDATEFCNWLSKRDGLPVAYRNGKLIRPVTTGYRLPTEAEWVWAARYSGGKGERLYAWGNTMPPTGKAGNYADVSSSGVVELTLSEYNDGFIAAAPVGRFDPNPLGLYDLGGNVSEWMNDHYSVEISMSVETDPLGEGDSELHTIRGSSWRHGRITELRLVYRDSGADGRDDVGFRLARYAQAGH